MAAQPVLQCISAVNEEAALLVCPSDLTRGREHHLLGLALPAIERSGLVIDMSRVDSIDAAGIGTLVFLRQCADRAGTAMTLANPSTRVREMLALVHLDSVLLAS